MEKLATALIHGNVARSINDLPELGADNIECPVDAEAYVVYDLVPGEATQREWSAALLEINSSPKHYHRREKEIFTVVQGLLAIELDNEVTILHAGESVTVRPGVVHQLKSADQLPVRVLCVSFPAFDPEDMHCVE